MAESSSRSDEGSVVADVKGEEMRSRVRKKLNADQVKLWLPPYTTESGERGHLPQEMIDKYANELELGGLEVTACLEELRLHALEKLAARRLYEVQGLATLNIKLAGNLPQEVTSKKISLEFGLTSTGHDLKVAVASRCNASADMLKLICAGHVVDDSQSLQQQHVKNGAAVMAVCVSATEAEARRDEQQAAKLALTRQGAELLAAKEDGGKDDSENYYLQIADQSGQPLDMPKHERKALVLAMTLHEKGRAVLKQKEFGDALLLLLEADKEFKKCRSDILASVDNYALLCLDIVWCYLRLRNLADLPDAEARLQACDDCFRKSYGPTLERLALVKGGTGNEKALFMRLHLLQGVLAFHQHRYSQATQLLHRAERELKALTVDESSMLQVMQMGFTQQEARLGLRMTEGNIQLAVAHIMRRRDEKKEVEAKVKAEKRERRLQEEFGNTAEGKKVNIKHYDSMVSMGYAKGAAAEALKQANNDLNLALQVLSDHPELLSLPDPEPTTFKLTDDMVAQVRAMGFDEDSARAALHKFQDVRRAIEELLQAGGVAPPAWLQALPTPTPSTSGGGASKDNQPPGKSAEEKKREKELMDEIIRDLPRDEEEHLDLTLEEESNLLHEYVTYVTSLST